MVKFMLIVVLVVIVILAVYDISMSNEVYDIVAINRFTRRGIAINYRQGFQIWCLGCEADGSIVGEKVIFGKPQ